MSTTPVSVPFFPIPPLNYDQRYFNEVIRSFSVFVAQQNNPGVGVFETINLLNLPTYADNAAAKTGGLSDGDVYRTSTGDLKVVYT
jgi:hypothetical protein